MSASRDRSLRCLVALALGGTLGLGLLQVAGCAANVHLGDLYVDADGGQPVPDVSVDPPALAEEASIDPRAAVANVSGLVLWLDGDRGMSRADGGLTWTDQSGHGNDAFAPRAVPPSTDQGFNGHTGVAFDSTQMLRITDSPSLRFAGDYTVLVVARSSTPPSDYGALFGKTPEIYPFPGPGMYVNYQPLSKTPTSGVGAQIDFTTFVISADTSVSDGVTRLFEMRRTGTLLSVRVDSNTPTSATVPVVDVSAPQTDVYIGGHEETSVVQGLTGAIAEVLAVNGTSSADDYATLHSYLTQKYAIR